MATIIGTEPLSNKTRKGQVYQATHKGDSENYLPFMNRSFISFSFGERNNKRVNIEDFDLLATINGNSLNRSGYAEFEDTITTYDNLEGQQYWGTHSKANKISFTLSTDGIEQKKLDDFLHWFRAGDTKELILAEHPNRAILARVAQPPQLNLLPFEAVIEVPILNTTYKTSTTLYKGDINLELVMDEPYWYAKQNVLGIKDGTRYLDEWFDANNNRVWIIQSQDALKIVYEDGIPIGSMIQSDMLLGDGSFASVEERIETKIWDTSSSITRPNRENLAGGGACIMADETDQQYLGFISGALIDASGGGITHLYPIDSNMSPAIGHFFYSGTAPSPTIISFSLQPEIDNQGYIISPYNSHTSVKYNTLTIESINKQELRFTTPNIFTSYNKAIEIFHTQNNMTDEDLRAKIRDNVRHSAVREWAIHVIDDSEITNNVEGMKLFLQDDKGVIPSCIFTFNSENGDALGEFKYRTIGNTSNVISNFVTEDVGDMLLSNYIIIRDRNYPTSEGVVVAWADDNKQYSHKFYHDVSGGLNAIQILYHNMYL